MRNSFYRALSVAAGVAAALLALEGVLQLFSTPGVPPVPHAAQDAFDAPVVVTKQMEEGIALSRFTTAGARLTGNRPIPGAPVVLLLGDSYVVAREVEDEATMGGQLERLARSEELSINVRQYGWRGASAAQYLDAAGEMLRRWNPSQVVIVLDEGDLGVDALNRKFPRMAIGDDDHVSVVHSPDQRSNIDLATAAGGQQRSGSALVGLIRARWQRILSRAPPSVQRWGRADIETRGPEPDAASLAAVPRATVKALVSSFGSELAIIYVADVRVATGHTREKGETELLHECARLGVRCSSTRDAMLAARSRGIIARGFPTTTLGVGHLNPAGHKLMAQEIWKLIGTGPVPAATPRMAAR